jgi:hypothetical protein
MKGRAKVVFNIICCANESMCISELRTKQKSSSSLVCKPMQPEVSVKQVRNCMEKHTRKCWAPRLIGPSFYLVVIIGCLIMKIPKKKPPANKNKNFESHFSACIDTFQTFFEISNFHLLCRDYVYICFFFNEATTADKETLGGSSPNSPLLNHLNQMV